MVKGKAKTSNVDQMIRLFMKGKCPFCKKKMAFQRFRDVEGFKKFQNTGTCQSCQDAYLEEEVYKKILDVIKDRESNESI